MKKLALILALACSTAGAADIERSFDINLQLLNGGSWYADISDTFGSADVGKTYSDKFNFHMPDTAYFYSYIAPYKEGSGFGDIDITGFGLNGTGGSIESHFHNVYMWYMHSGGLQDGRYFIQVDGRVRNAGSIFGAITSVPAAAIPEPATYAMMLAGIAALGAVVRKKKLAV